MPLLLNTLWRLAKEVGSEAAFSHAIFAPMVPCHRWMYCKAPVMVSSIKQGFRRSGNGDCDPEGLTL